MSGNSFVMTCAAMAICFFCGCETVTVPPSPTGTQVVDSGEVILGGAEDVTMYDLESAARQLMSKMLANAGFKRNYSAKKKAKGSLPVVIVGDIENRMPPGVRCKSRLEIVRDGIVRTALFDSGLFVVVSAAAESPADYKVVGDFRQELDAGGFYSYYLRLAVLDMENDVRVWESTQKATKR